MAKKNQTIDIHATIAAALVKNAAGLLGGKRQTLALEKFDRQTGLSLPSPFAAALARKFAANGQPVTHADIMQAAAKSDALYFNRSTGTVQTATARAAEVAIQRAAREAVKASVAKSLDVDVEL